MSPSLPTFLPTPPLHYSSLLPHRTLTTLRPSTPFLPARHPPPLLPRAPVMHSQSTPPPHSDLSPPPSTPENLTTGFALADLPQISFSTLSSDDPALRRPGAYLIRDDNNTICYMGYSKNVASKLAYHVDCIPAKCVSFQAYFPPIPYHLVSPDVLENVLEFWVRENGGIPTGNTVDRPLWERPLDRKQPPQQQSQTHSATTPSQTPSQQPQPHKIPVRERTTPRRQSTRRAASPDPFVDNFRSATGATPRRKRNNRASPWGPADDDDYVEVDVDPLDPFSASKKRQSTRPAWDFQAEDDDTVDDWMPIVALMGCAGLIWLFGMLSNALPAASPSLGM